MVRRLGEEAVRRIDNLWHSRMHVSTELLKWLNGRATCGEDDAGAKKVLDDPSLGEDVGICETCAQGKARVQHGRPAASDYTISGHLVGVDTFTIGYKGTPTLGGKRFCIVFVDFASRHSGFICSRITLVGLLRME